MEMEIRTLVVGIKESTTESLLQIRDDIQERVEIQAGYAMTENEFFQQTFFSNDCVRLALINKELSERKLNKENTRQEQVLGG